VLPLAGEECDPPGTVVDCSVGTVTGRQVCLTTCTFGPCECVPSCTGRECGPDGCGGSCGLCGRGFECVEASGQCVPHTLVFVTSIVTDADIGGLRAADDRCNAVATAARLPGRYGAILSDGSTPAADRFTPAGPIFNTAEEEVSSTWAFMWSRPLLAPIARNELGGLLRGAQVWTGSTASGDPANVCNDWNFLFFWTTGTVGISDQPDADWVSSGTLDCDSGAHLYCIRTD
jgi:hypothetical protein